MGVLEQFRLNGKVALVTGGAGLYGRQIVRSLAEAGAKVFVASRDLHKLQKQASELKADGMQVEALQLDQKSAASVEEMLKEIVGAAGKVDVLVNNAVLRTMRGWSSSGE